MKNNVILQAYALLNASLRRKFNFFILLSFVAVLFEVFSIGFILPVIEAFQNPENSILSRVLKDVMGISQKFLFPVIVTLIILIFLFKVIYLVYYTRFKSVFIFSIEHQLSSKVLAVYLRKDYNEFRKVNTSFMARDILGELSIYRNFLLMLSLLLVEIFDVLGILGIMFYTNFWSTLFSLLFLIASAAFFLLLIRSRTRIIGKRRMSLEGERLKETNLVLQNYKYIKVNQLEELSFSIVDRLSKELSILLSSNDFYKNVSKYLFEFLGVVSVLVYIASLYFFSEIRDSAKLLPALGIFLVGSSRLMPSANRIVSALNTMTFSAPTISKLYELINSDQKTVEPQGYYQDYNEIFFKNLSFKFDDSDSYLFKDFSHKIFRHDFVGVIGESGRGKSTLINLFLGLQAPVQGGIYVDGQRINKNRIGSFRSIISYIPQDFILMDDSLSNNITYYSQNINLSKLNEIVVSLELKDLVDRFENPSRTIGENGNRLSGGQRQRVAIARALFKGASILVMDEPFSALDDDSTNDIVNVLNKLKGSLTILVVTHKIPDNLIFNNVINL